MKYGKLLDISNVDFRLPDDPPENSIFFEKRKIKPSSKEIFIGATGYNMREWKGKWYTPKAKPSFFLRQYGEQFNGIEHNTTHYRIPDAATIQRWYDETPADFRFSPKIPQSISHRSDLGLHSDDLERFCTAILGLKEKLGACFMQLPPYFSVERLAVLEQFLETIPKALPLTVEVRHPTFYTESIQAEAYFDLLEAHKVGTVITDVAGARQDCHCRLTAPFVVIRLVGNDLYKTDYQRVDFWAKRLDAWFAMGLETAYVFCHEPDNILAPDYCAIAGKVFSEKIKGVSLRYPQPLPDVGVQGSLF